jgi:glutamate carboxypeptidase
LLGKRGLLHLVRGAPEQAWVDFDEAVRKNEARGSAALAGASLADRAMACFALGRDQDARDDLERARVMLHHPDDRSAEGRMLFAAEPLGRAFFARWRGETPAAVTAAARAELAPIFSGAPASWDIVQRLVEWLIDALEKGGARATHVDLGHRSEAHFSRANAVHSPIMATDSLLASAVAGRTEEMLSFLERLVRQNSYTQHKAGGDAVGHLLAARASELGLEVLRQPSERFADHLVFSAEGVADGFVALVGHIDTVFPEGAFEVFARDGDRLRGPGVLDMKGGIVVMLEAVRALREAGIRPNLKILLVGDEEIGSPEGRPFLERHARGASAALVFEAGRAADRIITSRKGTGSLSVTARGRAAHAANNHKDGVNAILAMAHFVTEAQALTNYELGTTVNVGVIRGGEAKNTVPDQCEVEVDFRFVTVTEADRAEARLLEAARTAEARVPGAQLTVRGGKGRYPLERTPANVALLERYADEARRAGLGAEEAPLVAGGSDASTTSAIGIPSIDGMGPRGAGFHTKDEYIEIASLEPKTLALASFLARWATR